VGIGARRSEMGRVAPRIPYDEGSAQVLACSLNHAVGKAGGAKAKKSKSFRETGAVGVQYPSAALARKPADG